MTQESPVLLAIREQRGLARELGHLLGITREAVWMWRQVPAKHALSVAKYMKLPPHIVRPDLYPPPTRKPQNRQSD